MHKLLSLAAAAAVALFLALPAGPAAAQGGPASVVELGVAGPLGDKAIGNADAPVTVIEYASITCSHCARFHNETFDAFKAKYVDTGKVRFIFREYPLDGLSAAVFMVARCVPEDRYFSMVDLLFEKQAEWAFVQDPAAALVTVLAGDGFDRAKLEECTKNQAVLDHILAVRDRGEKVFGISGTPTFFINGQRRSGAMSIEEIDGVLAPLL